MNNSNVIIIEYLERYVELKDPKYAVLLKGKWGCGKTYFVKNILNEWKSDKKIDNDGFILKPIYISLNGISSIKYINYLLNKEISPLLYSKSAQILKRIGKAASKGILKLDFNENNEQQDISFEISPLDIFMSDNDNEIKGKRILVFDDLERCKIAPDELFGYINNFVEHQKCKVIIIGYEDKIIEKENYKEINEKLVGQSFTIKEDIESAINQFYIDSSECLSNPILKLHKEIIIRVFQTGQTSNLRVLRQAFLDFDRLLDLLEIDFNKAIKEEKYINYVHNIVVYYILVYCEYRTGNHEISKYQDLKVLHKEKDNNELKKLYNKYDLFISRNKLLHSSTVVPVNALIQFITTGIIDKNLLSDIIINKKQILYSKDIQPWEIVYNRYETENKEFVKNIGIIKSQFFSCSINAIFEVLHISALLLFYKKEEIIKLNKNQDVIKYAKKNIDKILSENSDFSSVETALSYSENGIREYADDESNEFKDIRDYAYFRKETLKFQKALDDLKNYLENITNENIGAMESMVNRTAQTLKAREESFAMFANIKVNKFLRQLLKLSIKSKNDFKFFLQNRYFINERYEKISISKEKKEDLIFIEKLKILLEKEILKLKYMDKYTIRELINTMERVILKMKL